MAHVEAPYGAGVVPAGARLPRVEPDALADDGGLGAGGAPDGEGHLEAHRLGGDGRDATVGVVAADGRGGGAGGAAPVEGVGVRFGAFYVWRDVASHVEALHGG